MRAEVTRKERVSYWEVVFFVDRCFCLDRCDRYSSYFEHVMISCHTFFNKKPVNGISDLSGYFV